MHSERYPARPPRFPIGLVLAVALLALAVVGSIAGWAIWQWYTLETTMPTVASAIRVALFALPIAGAVEIGVIVWRRWADRRFIQAHHVTMLERARNQPAPRATSFSYHNSPKIEGAPIEATQPALLPAPSSDVPTFAQLLDAGKIGQGRPLLLGYRADNGDPIEGTWSKLYSVGLGGMTGSGKTSTAAFLLAQSVAASNARLIVIDPHAGDAESLSSRIAGLSEAYRCDVAQSGAAIESALKLAANLLAQRIAGNPASEPLILIADEWTSLLRGKLGELLTSVALDYSEQGRKFGCFGMFCAQAWQVEAAGPVRDRLASHYAMRCRSEQFRYQLGLKGSAPVDTMFLQPGQAYFLSVAGDLQKIVIPRVETGDLARVGAMIAQPGQVAGQPFGFNRATALATTPTAQATSSAGPVANRKPDGSLVVARADQATTAAGSAGSLSPEAARVLALLHEGNDLPAIVRELRGVASSEGRRYQTALAEVTDLLRQATKGGR